MGKNWINYPLMKDKEYFDIFRQSPISIEYYDCLGNLKDANQACIKLFGLSGVDSLKGFNLFTNPHLTEETKTDIRAGKAVRYELIYDFELIKRLKLFETSRNGVCHLECHINPTINPDNEVTGYSVHITERKKAEDSLLRKEEQYRMLLDLAPDAFFQGDSQGNFITVNKAAIELTGYTRAELLKMNMKDLFSEEYLIKKPLKYNLLEQGKVVITEREICQKSGNRIIVEMNSKKMPDGTYQSFFRNITERKNSELALKQSEEKFRRIIECSTSGMHFYKVEPNDRLIFTGANPAADKIIGISHQELIGKTILEAFPNLADTEIPALYTSIARGETGAQEFNLEYKDISISGIYNVQVFQTEMNCISVHFTEISDRLNAEKLLEKQSEELVKLNATKDKFLSIIAHDLKNPFNAIIGFSDLMIQNFHELDDDTLLQGLNTIETASKHAYKLLENLLAWSQNQTGRISFKPEYLNLYDQVNGSFRVIESSAKIKGINVGININKSLQVFADKDMFDSVLRNLILNAIKFSYRDGKIKISALTNDNQILISVKDEGVGIPLENQSAIFKIDKHTITTGTDNEQGTGLGLILCKDFVTRHKGTIWVESSPGKGSIFTFSLPIPSKAQKPS
jgi:PAS domain S-box-containing protein